MDTVSVKRRSEIMSLVRSRDTKPELFVRSLTHRLGYRFRLHSKRLPGRPDLVFASKQKVIYVHGCFWHSHRNCENARIPKSRKKFWEGKLSANKLRDGNNLRAIKRLGWSYLVLWECQLARPEALAGRIIEFLDEGYAE